MGLQSSQPLEKKLSKSKSSLSRKTNRNDDITDFISEISTLSCLRSTDQNSYQYVIQKLPFSGHYTPLPKCRTICRPGNTIFVCYDCSIDQRAFLCEQCFEKGNHDSHRFNVFVNNNNSRINFCRCGDEDFMKKKTICQTHAQAPKMTIPTVDAKQKNLFFSYFNEVFLVVKSLSHKGEYSQLINSILFYFEKMVNQNLYFSKIIAEFLLSKSVATPQKTNLAFILQKNNMTNHLEASILRNINMLPEYKLEFIKEIFLNTSAMHDDQFCELLLNFAGKIDVLNDLAKKQGIMTKSDTFLRKIISSKVNAVQIWKCIIDKYGIKEYLNQNNIMKAIFEAMKDQQKYVMKILQQLLDEDINRSKQYVIACLMVLEPKMFLGGKKDKLKTLEKLDKKFYEYYTRIFEQINTYKSNQYIFPQMIILLPYFSFGNYIINKFWDEFDVRLEVISKNKQRSVIREASNTFFTIITLFLDKFVLWQHNLLKKANTYNLKEYTKDKKLVQRLLIEVFDKKPKIFRNQILPIIDQYTQKQRDLAADVIKKNLRYNSRKQKYYNVSKKLLNNPYNNRQLNVGCPLKLSDWQQFVSSIFFNSTFYSIVPKLIKFAQKGLMEDIEMVKTVSYITSVMSILKRSQKKDLKQITRNFIKEIPDVKEDVYYVLAGIRDRLELDIDQIEQSGKSGKKKVKLDLITQIRDKKFKQMRQKQQKIRLKWLKDAERGQSDHQPDTQEDICYVCKQKDDQKRRFVYPCNFTRNHVISSLLRSEVTDLDINVCLHKVHEDCFDKFQRKGECQICKFQINCYIPQKSLPDQSFTKNWMRTFERIVTTINLQSGKSFNSDWATIFLTYLIYSKSFKVLLNSTEVQQEQRKKVDQLILYHYKDQYQKWQQLTKQSLKKAQKTVKGQVTRQSNTKKVVKSLVMDLVLQQITQQPFKNVKRIHKKFREMINMIGCEKSAKINECFPWSRDNEDIQQIFDTNQTAQDLEMFKIRQFPKTTKDYIKTTSIKCPMCNKYQPQSWECLFCEKKSCGNCMNTRFHCERDHRGCGIILNLNDATYDLYYDNRVIESDSLYRNEYSEGWKRNNQPEGWNVCTDQIYNFFDKILHSINPNKVQNYNDNNSDDGFERGWQEPVEQVEQVEYQEDGEQYEDEYDE